MTYKGVYRDGIVVLQGTVDLENGTRVEVNPARKARAAKAARTGKPRASSKGVSDAEPLPGFGMWKDRWPKSRKTADIARELRERVSRRVP